LFAYIAFMFTRRATKENLCEKTDCFIGLFGCDGVGKSALVHRFISDEFAQEYNPTIEPNYHHKLPIEDSYQKHITVGGKGVLLNILDTGGQEKYSMVCNHQYQMRQLDVALVVFDFTRRDSLKYEEVKEFVDGFRRMKGKLGAPIILVGNKFDLVKDRMVSNGKDTVRMVSDDEFHDTAKRLSIPYMVASAKTKEGVDKAFVDAYKAHRFPFNFMCPLKIGDWVYVDSLPILMRSFEGRKFTQNIAIIKSKSDEEMKVYYFERPFWFNSATIKERRYITPVPYIDMLSRIFLEWQPFGLYIPEMVIWHIEEYMPERDFGFDLRPTYYTPDELPPGGRPLGSLGSGQIYRLAA